MLINVYVLLTVYISACFYSVLSSVKVLFSFNQFLLYFWEFCCGCLPRVFGHNSESDKTSKTAKAIDFESFQLYGMLCISHVKVHGRMEKNLNEFCRNGLGGETTCSQVACTFYFFTHHHLCIARPHHPCLRGTEGIVWLR